jgi:hypothetical protein
MKRKKMNTLAINKTTIMNLNATSLGEARGGVDPTSVEPTCLDHTCWSCPATACGPTCPAISCFHFCSPFESVKNCYTEIMEDCPTGNPPIC